MKTGRLRKLLLSLFLVATVTSALHTLVHHHAHDSCPVCAVAEHTTAPDVVPPLPLVQKTGFEPLPPFQALPCRCIRHHFVSTRAPPVQL